MRKNVPSRICDRCGNVYYQDVYNENEKKGVDFKASLDWKDPEKVQTPRDYHLRFKDLCEGCAIRIQSILATLVMNREYDTVTIPEPDAEEITRGHKPEKEEG